MRYLGLTPFVVAVFSQSSFAALALYEKRVSMPAHVYRGNTELAMSPEGYLCLTVPALRQLGFDEKTLTTLPVSEFGCILPESLHQQNIVYSYQQDAQSVAVAVPALQNSAAPSKKKDYRSQWDDGVNAAFVSYNLAYNHYGGENYRDEESRNDFSASLEYGLNLGAWRFRYNHDYQRDTSGERQWYTRSAYVERDLKSLRSRIKIGDNFTPPDIFDSYPFRGVMLYSDDRMLPDRLRAFAPRIRGIADTNAEVRIWQNGVMIYHTFVPPGPFVLNDVYPPAQDGNLYITIKESNGEEKIRLLPYASMPNLTYPNSFKYSLAIGEYRPYYYVHDEGEKPKFGHVTMTYGLPNRFTIYSGLITAPTYTSMAIGVGRSLGVLGAASFDYRYSRSQQPRYNRDDHGGVFRLRHAKAFFDYGINISSLGEYYPRQDFRSFSESIQQQKIDWWDLDDEGHYVGLRPLQKRYRIETRLNQYVNNTDSVYFTASRQQYYQPNNRSTSLQVGYSGSAKNFDYNIDYGYNKLASYDADRRLTMNISIPLNRVHLPRMRLKIMENSNFRDNRRHSVMLSGTALTNYSLGYGVSVGKGKRQGTMVDTNVYYNHNAGEFNAWYSQGKGYQQVNLAATGSVVFHAGGVTLGQELGETNAVIRLPDSPSVTVDNQFGVMTDSQGYAVITDLAAYRKNMLTLDEYSLDFDQYLPQSEIEVMPTNGAIVFREFPAVKYESEEDDDDDDDDDEDSDDDDNLSASFVLGFVEPPRISFLK